jgi:single-strand DNA-binding protein
MFDTHVTVVGTVTTAPEWRRVQKTGAIVTSFRVASHSRRFDRTKEQWIDGPSLRLRVHCWRRLAEGVSASVMVGDPVVVYGRISTRDWKTEQGEARVSYEIEADSIGHDLSRGQARFQRYKPEMTSVVEDPDTEGRVNGEVSENLHSTGAAPVYQRDESFDDFAFSDDFSLDVAPGESRGPTAGRADGGRPEPDDDRRDSGSDSGSEDDLDGEATDGEAMDGEATNGAATGPGGSSGRSSRRGRAPVPA